MLRVIFAGLLCIVGVAARADQSLSETGFKTSTFAMSFPHGWKLEQKKSPVPLRGQHGEQILIYAILPNPAKELPQGVAGDRIRDFWRNKIREELSAAVSREGMSITQPLKETQVQGLPFFSAASHRTKEEAFFAGYGLIGRGDVVFIVTVEGWIDDEIRARQAAEQMLQSVTWFGK